jgi:hypothetical protein
MRIWFDPLRLLRSSPASSARRRLVRRGNQWLLRLSLSATYRPPPPFRRKAILIILQSITPGMTRIIHRAGVGVTYGAGDGLSEFPLDFADAGTAGSAAAHSDQASDASVLRMRVLVAVSAGAVADSMITPAPFRSDRQVKRSRVARSGAHPVVGTPPPLRAGAAERVLELNAAFERDGVEPWARQTMGGRLGSDFPPKGVEWWIKFIGRTVVSTQIGFMKTIACAEATLDFVARHGAAR